MSLAAISFDDVQQAAERIRGVANRTPVVGSRNLDALVGGRVFLKCENLQRGGSFKFRGAYNRLTEDREALAQRVATERGLTLVPPYDHPLIMAGQGTAALELVEEAGRLDWLLAPVGGGGLLSGT